MENKEINLLEYIYEPGQMVEIPGRLMEGIIQLLKLVEDNERKQGFCFSYDIKIKKKFDKEKKLESVDTERENYETAEAFFNQKPKEYLSMLGAMAVDLGMQFKQGHLKNINDGIAKKIGSFKEQEIKL